MIHKAMEEFYVFVSSEDFVHRCQNQQPAYGRISPSQPIRGDA